MRLHDVQQWNHQSWTQHYEAALFEKDKVKLCALIWNAQLAIIGRTREIKPLSKHDEQEPIALKKALGILQDLGRLSGLEDAMKRTLVLAGAGVSGARSRQSGSRMARQALRRA
jgi:hypothetical protein